MNLSQSTQDLRSILSTMKRAHVKAGPATLARRQDRLARSIRLIKENHVDICRAMSDDFGHRSQYQSLVADVATTIKQLQNAYDNVAEWMKAEEIQPPEQGMQTRIESQALGVIGVISPWNFPINLSFGPLASIFAAGNTAMLKPSELTPKTSELLADLVGRYFDPMELEVVLGDADVGREFSALPFDHLVFTGSSSVGKHVMRSAAENLVPVTLELGGKSPVVLDSDFDLATAVQRTLTVKTFNVGQICLSPDYLLIPEGREQDVIVAAKAFMSQSFGTLQTNPDYTSIVNERHFNRLVGLLENARQKGATIVSLAPAGEPDFDEHSRKIAPHLIFNVSDDMAIMQEEIFGPLLPVKTWQKFDQAVAYINDHDRPLAAYLFSNNKEKQAQFAQHTTSGALVINDVMTHASIDELPFGGVGGSGRIMAYMASVSFPMPKRSSYKTSPGNLIYVYGRHTPIILLL